LLRELVRLREGLQSPTAGETEDNEPNIVPGLIDVSREAVRLRFQEGASSHILFESVELILALRNPNLIQKVFERLRPHWALLDREDLRAILSTVFLDLGSRDPESWLAACTLVPLVGWLGENANALSLKLARGVLNCRTA
jgi:hypothetical protein